MNRPPLQATSPAPSRLLVEGLKLLPLRFDYKPRPLLPLAGDRGCHTPGERMPVVNMDLALLREELEGCLHLGMERQALRLAGRILRSQNLNAIAFDSAVNALLICENRLRRWLARVESAFAALEVGAWAKRLYPDGNEVGEGVVELKEVAARTQQQLPSRKPLFEPAFLTPTCYARADIMVPVGRNQWDVVEVKSSTKPKDINFHDLAFQRHVFETAGLKIYEKMMIRLNSDLVRQACRARRPDGINAEHFYCNRSSVNAQSSVERLMKRQSTKIFCRHDFSQLRRQLCVNQ